MSIANHQPVRMRRLGPGGERAVDDCLAEEVPVALFYNGRSHAVMMASPSDLEDFAMGFTLSEGIVERGERLEIVQVLEHADGVAVHLLIPQRRHDALAERHRNLVGRSGCGLCGAAELADAIRPVSAVSPLARAWGAVDLAALFARLEAQQQLNALTGAVHAAGLLCDDGCLIVREDVGRHNAVDKVIGAALRAGVAPRMLLVTSRASYEIVHKAASVGCAAVAAISAPTALAVRLAIDSGLSLAGFVRGERLNVYAGAAFDAGSCAAVA